MSDINYCDNCNKKENTNNLIWITSEDFTPLKDEKIPKELYNKFDALCEDCYIKLIRRVEEFKKQENKHLTLYWVDKLKELQEEHPENPLKALYLFEAWGIEEENKFNKRWYNE